MVCVIGSGPSSAACLQALTESGETPVVLDAGVQMEESRARVVETYRATSDPAALAEIKGGMLANAKGIPLKMLFGSDFPYREAAESLQIVENDTGVQPSFALGGLSNVWGAVMMPHSQQDLEEWPISSEDLIPHYKAIANLTRLVAGQGESLEEKFPVFAETPGDLAMNLQGRQLFADLNHSKDRLRRDGILFGRGRVAVASAAAGRAGCEYRGLCMFGCPEGYIYNSRDTIQQMEKDGKISYRGDTIVRRLLEENGRVKIEAVQRKTGEPLHFDASRVFLAAGAIPSTRILIESLDLFGRTLRMKDSQYFLLPFLRFAGACGVQAESANTLCQLFIEMASDTVISKGVHLQIYGYNEFVGQAIRSSLGPIGRLLPRFSRELEERTLVFQGYLHSDLSGAIDITVDRPDAAGLSPMRLKSRFNPETKKTIRTVIKKLCSQALPLRGVPLFPMLQVAPPGRGFHTGGTFPMSCNPGPLESDTLGRPYGFTKVHVVDSTVLPSLPATTITFSVMANAHRIASLASRLPQR